MMLLVSTAGQAAASGKRSRRDCIALAREESRRKFGGHESSTTAMHPDGTVSVCTVPNVTVERSAVERWGSFVEADCTAGWRASKSAT